MFVQSCLIVDLDVLMAGKTIETLNNHLGKYSGDVDLSD